jgi:hypothetical protein
MARPKIHPQILADKGVPLVLLGKAFTLCYGFQALMLVEERFGSIQGAIDLLESMDPKDGTAISGKAFTSLVDLMACGMAHEVGDDGEDLSQPAMLAYYCDTEALPSYAEAIATAFTRAFPKAPEGADQGGEEQVDPPSPGASGTGSPASTSASPSESSGA